MLGLDRHLRVDALAAAWLGAALMTAVGAGGCASPRSRAALALEPLPLVVAPGSELPRLATAPDGSLRLSWIEPTAAGEHALRFAALDDHGWAHPRTIAAGPDWLINWADVPSVAVLSDGGMLAHWLRKRATGGYDVALARSRDRGATWSAPWTPHLDDTDTEHGFVSLVPRAGGRALVLWLDGRAFAGLDESTAEQHAAMALRYVELAGGAARSAAAADSDLGARSEPAADSGMLDPRTCSCCQTSAAAVGDTVVVAYRDRSADEVRDIAVVRFDHGQWTAPLAVAHDGWRIEGCPVSGPSLAAAGAHVAVAWFTAAGEIAQVKLARSEDGGRHFAAPVRVDDGHPQGRAAVVLAGDRAVVAWLERNGATVELRIRSVRDGRRSASRLVQSSPVGRVSSVPQLAVRGADLVMAWTTTDATGVPRVRSGRVALSAL